MCCFLRKNNEKRWKVWLLIGSSRDSFTLETKLPAWEMKTIDDVERIFNEQLDRMARLRFLVWLQSIRFSSYSSSYKSKL